MYTDMAEEQMTEPEHQEHPSNWEVVLFANDVKLQATTPGKRQQLLDVSACGQCIFCMKWSTDNCKIMAPKIGGKELYTDSQTRNCRSLTRLNPFGVMATNEGVLL